MRFHNRHRLTTMLKKVTLNLQPIIRNSRFVSAISVKPQENVEDKMQAWQIHSYGGLDELKLSNVRIPVIASPTEILVKVEATSVNPIDIAMCRGYGATLLNLMRKVKNFSGSQYTELELPLILGRDFSGIVIAKGHNVRNNIKIGDEVWGVVPVEQQGCHATHVVVNNSLVAEKPKNLSHVEAASILYAGLTAWSALWITGGLCYKSAKATKRNNKVLVLGGSGGVGTLAIQLLKAWNMHVVTTCSSDAANLVQQLGAEVVIDYKEDTAETRIISEGPYDIILDCTNQKLADAHLNNYPTCSYITLNSPLLRNIDQSGIVAGTLKNIRELVKYNIPISKNKSFVKWGFFMPSQIGIKTFKKLVENEKVIPVIASVFKFHDLPSAYETMAQGHLRGKVVIDMR